MKLLGFGKNKNGELVTVFENKGRFYISNPPTLELLREKTDMYLLDHSARTLRLVKIDPVTKFKEISLPITIRNKRYDTISSLVKEGGFKLLSAIKDNFQAIFLLTNWQRQNFLVNWATRTIRVADREEIGSIEEKVSLPVYWGRKKFTKMSALIREMERDGFKQTISRSKKKDIFRPGMVIRLKHPPSDFTKEWEWQITEVIGDRIFVKDLRSKNYITKVFQIKSVRRKIKGKKVGG